MVKLENRNYLKVSGLIFTVVALMHLGRFLFGWNVQIADWQLPTWLSLVAAVVAGYLAYSAYKLMK